MTSTNVTRSFLLALLVVLVGIASGCMTSAAVRDVARTLEADLDGLGLQREMHLRLGPLSLGLVRAIVRAADDDGEAMRYLETMRSVEVSLYRVDRPADPALLTSVPDLQQRLARRGWTPMVTARDEGDLTWVFTKERDGGSIAGVFVVALDNDELTVVRLRGDLDRILAEAIAENPDALVEGVTSES